MTQSARKPALGRKIRRKLRTLGHLWWIIALGLVMIGIGALLLERYHASDSMAAKLAGLFISELGFACLISAIIFAIMEEWSAREHGKTAIGHLYGVRPVGYFFEKIEKHVLKQRFYRDRAVIKYIFEKQSGENFLIRLHADYFVTNMCTHDDEGEDEFQLTGAILKKPLHTAATEWDDMLGVSEIRIDKEVVPLDHFEIEDDPARRTQTYRAKSDGKKKIPFRHSARIEATHYLVKHDHDSAVWMATVPSRRVELHILWDPAMRLEFAADAIHPDANPLKPEKGPNSLILRVDEPFLIGHGFHFWWSPKAEAPPGEAPAPAPAPA